MFNSIYLFIGPNEVREFAIIPLAPENIVDTNGAGDAFVGGKSQSMIV